jgi:hypothetical protein
VTYVFTACADVESATHLRPFAFVVVVIAFPGHCRETRRCFMRSDATRFLFGALLLAVLTSASCNGVVPAEPTAPTAPTAGEPVALAVEPARVTPEFLPPSGLHCGGARPFRTRFVVILGAEPGLVVTSLNVGFSDRFGVISLPSVLGSTSALAGPAMSGPSPVPLPTSTPIPFPTTGPNSGLIESIGSSQRVPVILEFGCLVRPQGTIVLIARTRDRHGRRDHQLTIDVGD